MSAYELLTIESVPAYVASRPALAARVDHVTDVREVGDGNLNLVFVVSGKDASGGAASLVLKQSLPYVRADPSWPMTPARNHAEARALAVHGRLAPDAVPALYDTDPERFVLAVEDLSDHRVWRGALVDGERHDGAAAAIGRYVAQVAFGTSAFGMESGPQKELLAAAVNPALRAITEALVFTEPYTRPGHVLAANEPDVAAYAGDPDVVAAIGAAKWTFMTHAEALIHGDLHTGSVMVRTEPASTKAFDSEFAFYGPVGFDLGALWANLLLAAARAAVLGDEENLRWRLAQPSLAWQAFEETFRALWPGRVEPFPDRTLERFLERVRRDAVAITAAKAARRVIGPYPVADIETLPEPERVRAVRATLAACRYLLLDAQGSFDRVGDVLRTA